jgi:formylglycine-generating enzyme required for sulfatase activity
VNTRRAAGISRVTRWLMVVCLCPMLLGACGRVGPFSPARGSAVLQTRPTDEAVMIYVPDGEFLMGSTDADVKAGDDEKPQHTVYLEAFWIDETEVTNAQYVRFLNVLGGHQATCLGYDCVETQAGDRDSHIFRQDGRYVAEDGFKDHPVIEVTWYGAQAYCEWAGVRLPTEAEWEKAARGVDGRLYPWGDDAPDCRKAQYADCEGATVEVSSVPAGASLYGVLDMSGNVWEWVADWYGPAAYRSSPAQNPLGPDSGVRKVFRGGSWGYPAAFIRVSERARNRPTYAGFNVGFRCAAAER